MNIVLTKVCAKCAERKPLLDFGVDSSKTDGRRNTCRSCYNPIAAVNARKRAPYKAEYFKEYRRKNKSRLALSEAVRRLEKRHLCLISTARTRANKFSVAFDLDRHVDEVKRRLATGCCELSGVTLDLSPGRTAFSPSLDRIVASRGYTLTNIRIICFGLNAALGDWGEVALEKIVRAWLAGKPDAL